VTGALALIVVATSAVTAIIYAVTHGSETLVNLATSTLTGAGMAIGSLLGGALVMRFQSAREYVKKLVEGIK
jgi:uncharacterized membrane protein YfcA